MGLPGGSRSVHARSHLRKHMCGHQAGRGELRVNGCGCGRQVHSNSKHKFTSWPPGFYRSSSFAQRQGTPVLISPTPAHIRTRRSRDGVCGCAAHERQSLPFHTASPLTLTLTQTPHPHPSPSPSPQPLTLTPHPHPNPRPHPNSNP